MKLVEKMKARIAEHPDLADAKHERDQRAMEKQMASRAAARRQPQEGFTMPVLPERSAELIELADGAAPTLVTLRGTGRCRILSALN
jgi:hypothetical protein